MKAKWQTSKLADVCEQITDGKHGDCENQTDSGFYFLSAKDIFDGRLAYENARQITELDFNDTHKRTRLEPLDILFTNSGTIGRMALVPADERTLKTTFQKSVAILKAKRSAVAPRFLYYTLLAENRSLSDFAGGTAQKNLLLKDLRAFPIKVPPLAVQERIASALSAYDDLIENNTQRIKILEELAQMLYREWFVNFRFPGYQNVKMVESEIGLIPNGWRVSGIGEVTTKVGSGATPRGGKESYQTTGISLIRSLNVYDYRFEMGDLAFINDEQAQQLDNVTVEPNDVLLNITGASVGRCAMVPSYILPARVNQHVAIIRANPTKADPFFLLDTINHDRNKQTLLGIAQGGATREALTKETIIEFQILLPPFDLIRRYGQIASQLHEQRENLSRKNEVLRTTRDLLLPKLVSGEISVEQIEPESATETV